MRDLATFVLMSTATLCTAQTKLDIDTIRDHYIQSLLPPSVPEQQSLCEKALKLADSLAQDGTWPDVDYVSPETSLWPTSHHLEHTLMLAKAARLLRSAGHQDPVLETRALLSLRLWLARDFQNPNWWWNQIGTLLRPELRTADLDRLQPILRRSIWATWTGANLVWGVTIQIVRGMIYDDVNAVAEGYARLYLEIRRAPLVQTNGKVGEGIQADNSFHQHGAQFYSSGYGLVYAVDIGRFVVSSWGTSLQISPACMEIYAAFLLDVEQWMIRGGTFDYSATGREITRVGKSAVPHDEAGRPISGSDSAYSLANVAGALATLSTPRQTEFRLFANRLNAIPNGTDVSGNKHFWNSDYMSHQRPSFATSVKMFSARTQNSEIVNGEGLTSMHLSDGVNLLYRTGDEYENIFPVWDWTLLPGTTALHATQPNGAPLTYEIKPVGQRGRTTFVGGVSDGHYGAAAMDLQRGPLSAKKAWFFFDKFYVALGAGITIVKGTTSADVATDINQSLLRWGVRVNHSEEPLLEGIHNYRKGALRLVTHDHTGYILGPNTVAVISDTVQTGRWSDIGTGSSAPVSLPVFNLWIDHGAAPQNATYQYTVLPNATDDETMTESAHPSVCVLSNTEHIQGVYVASLHRAAIVFRIAGYLETSLGTIAVDHPSILLVAVSKARITLTASNPENQPIALHVSINSITSTLNLPGGDDAGKSISLEVAASR
jgi:chondroitin AC lyase